MRITDVALIIPSYPPHYHYVYNVLNKLHQNNIQIDIFIVFSNQSDYEMFQLKGSIKPIILTTPLDGDMLKSIITRKKYFGLKQLIDSKYDYFIVCDSEMDIVPENFTPENIHKKVTNIFLNKQLYASHFNIGTWGIDIASNCANLFSGDDYDQIKLATNNFMYYSWFSDIPVYRRTDLRDFFEKINYSNINFFHFDHLIYQYYLIVAHNFKVINTSTITNQPDYSLEQLHTNNEDILNKLSDIGYGFGWLSKYTFNYHSSYFLGKGLFIIYHLDRN